MVKFTILRITGGVMGNLENKIEKLCSFYVNDWHLVTMILPYINKELNEKANIVTILENSIEENIKMMLAKLRLKNEKNILAIDWDSTNVEKQHEILKKVECIVKNQKEINIVLINGTGKYIDKVNACFMQNLPKVSKKLKNFKIKIINCYEVTEFNGSIKQILDSHDKILNTSGEKQIGEVFEGYSKMSDVG